MREETEAVKNQIRMAAQDEKNQLDSRMGDLKSDLQDEQSRVAELESKVNQPVTQPTFTCSKSAI